MTDVSQDAWDSLVDLLNRFQTSLDRSRATTISNAALRDAGKKIVQQYFRYTKPHLVGLQIDADNLATLDSQMQSLLVLSNRRSRKRAYSQLLRQIGRFLQDVEFERENRLGQRIASPTVQQATPLTSVESRIFETLTQLVPSAALSYKQAIQIGRASC